MKRRIAGTIVLVALVAFLMGSHSVSRLVPMSLGEAAAAGQIGSITSVNKFGRAVDSDQTEQAIWDSHDVGGPIRCFDIIGTTAAALYLSSDDENDAGEDVTIMYLDANWDLVTIDVTLGTASASGTVFVQISNETIMRINRMFATDTALVGNIYASTDPSDGGTDGVPDDIINQLVAVITIGENQTLQACYSVKKGFNALLTQFCTTNVSVVANASVVFRLRKSAEGAAARTQELLELDEGAHQCVMHDPPIMFAEKTDIELTAVASAVNASTAGTFDLILIPDTAR